MERIELIFERRPKEYLGVGPQQVLVYVPMLAVERGGKEFPTEQ